MQGSKKIPINDLNQHITCKICNGYFIDATTIIECLHTFCRSCIVKYLENNKYCPVCDVQVHKTKPLLNIRPDKTIQDVVYKLVPRLFQNEMQRRREFYEGHPEAKPSSLETSGEAAYQHLLTPEETVCLTLNYHGSNGTPRYLRCPAAVSLAHLKKLIRAKYDLTDNHRVEMLYNQDCLPSSLTLMDVAYIYMWKRKGPIELTYRIYECSAKKLKLEPERRDSSQAAAVNNNNNNNWKEVQLRISETGEMSITGIQDAALGPSILEIVNSDQQKYKNEVVTTVVESKSSAAAAPSPPNKASPPPPKKELPGLKYIGKNAGVSTAPGGPSVVAPPPKIANSEIKPVEASPVSEHHLRDSPRLEAVKAEATAPGFLSGCATLSSATTTMVFSTINSTKCSTKSEDAVSKGESVAAPAIKGEDACVPEREPPKAEPAKPPAAVANNVSEKSATKRKGDPVGEAEPPAKLPKPTILNHSLGLLNLSNNHPLKKHSKLNRNGESVKEIVLRSSTPVAEPTLSFPAPPAAKPPTTTITRTIVASTAATSESTFTKPSPLNKSLAAAATTQQLPNRPGTPVSFAKPPSAVVVASSSSSATKSSIIPPKPVNVYAGPVKSPCYMPKAAYGPIINVPKPATSAAKGVDGRASNAAKGECKAPSMPRIDGASSQQQPPQQQQQQIINLNNKLGTKSKPSSPIGYKTLRDPPKSWNSQISKANVNKPAPDPKYSELKSVRPAKFFKMRNNMPRYLGNPASGVKPMYQVHVSPEKEKAHQQEAAAATAATTNKSEKSEIRKHSIVKIDPKTLKPISEKAPETTSLSNHSSANQILSNHNQGYGGLGSLTTGNQSGANSHQGPAQADLKINTSSVSIFNPLKLQSSPKNDRKSPKSPHSPKLKAQAAGSPTGSKRDKVNLNFTPPNPFVPNLASPTMSPNQFLYPTGPASFPPYDPRMMAAYHSLLYGQRMGFPASPIPRLSLDLNQQRKNFEMMPSPTSPKTAGPGQQGHSPQISMKMTSATSSPKAQGAAPPAKSGPPSKKAPKEPKSEKSLETTVEKLTQSRNKEISEKSEQAQNATAAKAEAAAAASEKEKEKRLAGPSEHKQKEKPPEKKAKEKENGESGSSPVTEVAAPIDKDKPRDEGGPSGEPRSGGVAEKAPVENQNSDGAAAGKDSPRKDRKEEEEAAKSSPASDAAKSKDLGSNGSNVRDGGEGVVEGSK